MDKIWFLIFGVVFIAILLSHDPESKPVDKPIGSGWDKAAKATLIQGIDRIVPNP